MKPKDINLKNEVSLIEILDDYATDIEGIPTDEGKHFFRRWNDRVPAKLIRGCIFAGMHYALKNKGNLDIKWTDHICPKCGGSIEKVMIKYPRAWRWTCKECQRDFGYTDKPMTEDAEIIPEIILKECGLGEK